MNILIEKVLFKQLEDKEQLTEEQLKEIAGLIYDTDPYIYPAMFMNREEACLLIPKMITAGDRMFHRKNLYVALKDEHIIGLILWHKGPLYWNTDTYKEALNSTGRSASPYFAASKTQYFDSYREVHKNWISIINVCIANNYRNNRLGRRLIEIFLGQNWYCEGMELYVLKENVAAYQLYHSHGFVVTEILPGFSVHKEKPMCYRMCRKWTI